jgi:DNA-binding transcriptional LysR family regulator
MRLSHLEVCNAVLMAGSVTGAARLLHVSQPAVTKLLQSAENQLGFKLFTRERNRLVPTQEALALQPEIMQISSQIQRLKDLSRSLASERDGVLRIDCVPSVAATLLPAALERFKQHFPLLTCHIETQPHSGIIERLMRRQSDIGFALASIPNPAIIEETIARGRGVCVAPIGALAQSKVSVTWKDLARCRLIRIPASDQFGGLMIEAAHYQDHDAGGATTVTTNYLALRLAEQGLGVATIDSFTAGSANPARVRLLPITPEIAVELKSLHRFQAKLSHPARRFVQILAAVAQAASV